MTDSLPVAITGLGLTNALGTGVSRVWQRLLAGETGLYIDERYCELNQPFRISGRIPDLCPEAYVASRKALKMMNRFTVLALAAAHEAIRDAGLQPKDPRDRHGAVLLGSGFPIVISDDLMPALKAACEDGVFSLVKFGSETHRLISPLWPLLQLVNMPGCHLSVELGWTGPNWTLGQHEAGGGHAIAQAYDLIADGVVDLALCGGVDSRLLPHDALFFDLAGLVTHGDDPASSVRPFDRRADGFAPAEGAGMLVLESMERARMRGAPVRAVLSGVGRCGRRSAWMDESSRVQGLSAALSQVLPESEGGPPSLVYATGLAVPCLDAAESQAIRRTSEALASPVLVTASTGQHGYLGAASAATAAVLSVQSLSSGVTPGVYGLNEPADPSIRFATGRGCRFEGQRAIVLTNAMEGDHVALAIERVPV